MMQDPVEADRVVRTKTRHDEAFARHVEEHDEREEDCTTQYRRSRDDPSTIRQAVGQKKLTAMCSTGRKAMMVCTSKTQT